MNMNIYANDEIPVQVIKQRLKCYGQTKGGPKDEHAT